MSPFKFCFEIQLPPLHLGVYASRLPDGVREYIDERKNCEDIAMQLLVSEVTRRPPVYVPAPWTHYLWVKWEGFGVAGISKVSGHHEVRSGCVTELSRLFNPSRTPLIAAPLRGS